MKHTTQCEEMFAKHRESVEKYVKAWPNHCKKCGGWGGKSYWYNPAPGAPGSGKLQDWDDCLQCLGTGHCPRCSSVLGGDEDFCTECKWSLSCTDCYPDAPECLCYMEDEDRHWSEP